MEMDMTEKSPVEIFIWFMITRSGFSSNCCIRFYLSSRCDGIHLWCLRRFRQHRTEIYSIKYWFISICYGWSFRDYCFQNGRRTSHLSCFSVAKLAISHSFKIAEIYIILLINMRVECSKRVNIKPPSGNNDNDRKRKERCALCRKWHSKVIWSQIYATNAE